MYLFEKKIFIGNDYEVKLSVVVLYYVRMDQSLFTCFKEQFKLMIWVEREGKGKRLRAGNFRKIGQILGLNW